MYQKIRVFVWQPDRSNTLILFAIRNEVTCAGEHKTAYYKNNCDPFHLMEM